MLRRDGAVAPLEDGAPLDGGRSRLVPAHDHGARAAALRPLPAGRRSRHRLHAGDLPRFRVNVFRQRGAISLAFRVIPASVPSFEELGLPPGVEAPRRGAPRARARHRRDRLGQDDDARRDDRPHQPRRAGRTSSRSRTRSRSCTPITSRSSTSARSGLDTDELRPGAPPRAPPGPGHDPDRRAARRRDRADRAAGGRVGPPRLLDAAHDRRRRDGRAA